MTLFNRATITLYGADNPDSMRGEGWDGCFIDEFAEAAERLAGLLGIVPRPSR